MRRAVQALAAAAIVWALSAGGAAACRFAFPPTAKEHLARADVVFVGRVESTRQIADGWSETRFRVSRTLKGRGQAVRIVRQSTGTTCGSIRYRVGETAVVLARHLDGHLQTSVVLAPHFPLKAYERAAGRPR